MAEQNDFLVNQVSITPQYDVHVLVVIMRYRKVKCTQHFDLIARNFKKYRRQTLILQNEVFRNCACREHQKILHEGETGSISEPRL